MKEILSGYPSCDFVSFVVYELRHPRIDKCNRDIVKVRRIAGCQRGMLGEHDPAIIVSRSSPGRPFLCRDAIRSPASCAAATSNACKYWGSKWIDKRRASKSMFDGAYECACSRSYFRYLLQARL